jgi:ribosomal-protein-alanine N-acetyltransferase
VLAIRGLWCAEDRVPILAPEIVEIAADHGFTSVLSPPAPIDTLEPYLACDFRIAERLVVLQGLAEEVARATAARSHRIGTAATPALTVREATSRDLARLAEIDSWCFDSFWGYRDRELTEALAFERTVVALGEDGAIAGYATCSVHGASATIGRLAVDPHHRRRGVGTALLNDCVRWVLEKEAFAIGLCTQEHNTGSRALYEAAGLEELPTPYALAVREARRRHAS